jgi:hypothetical protein
VFPFDLDLLVDEPITSKGVKAASTTSSIMNTKNAKNAKNVLPAVQPIQDCNGAPITAKACSVSPIT